MAGMLKGFKGMVLPTSFSVPSVMQVKIGRPTMVSYSLLPSNSTNNKIRWSSANTSIATIDEYGVITGVGIGSTTITGITDANGITQTITIGVVSVPVTGITLSETDITMAPGETFQLEATVTPEDASNKNVEWSSSNTSVATVSSTGLVTCIADGECIITATTVDGGFTASCNLATGYAVNEHTLSYFPFKEDYTDKKGARTLTVNDSVIDEGSAKIKSKSSYMTLSSTIGGTNMTASLWYYPTAFNSSGNGDWNTIFARNGGTYHHLLISGGNSAEGTVGKVGFWNNSWTGSSAILKTNRWYNIIITKSGTNEKIYVNGELVLDSNSSFDNASYQLGMIANYSPSGDQGAHGKISEVIFEDVVWDFTKVTKYFNNSKKGYFGTIKDYDELEYIESDGNAWINTQIKASTVTKINIELSDIYQGSSYADSYSYIVFGTTASSWWMSSTYYTYSGSRFRYHFGDGTRRFFDCNATQTGVKNIIEYLPSSFTVNGNAGAQAGTDSSWGDASNYPICIWYCGNNSRSKYKLYYLKITTDVEHEYMPARHKSDGVLGLFDKTSGIFYPNDGSGAFTAGPKLGVQLNKNQLSLITAGDTYQLTVTPNPSSVGAEGYSWESSDTTIATVTPVPIRLPSTYQEVEYIESSGTQYIDTDFTPTNKTKVEFKISNWTQSGSHQIFGADNNWDVNGFSIVTDAYNFYSPVSINHGLTDGNIHEGSFSQQGFYVDGILKVTPGTYTFTSPCTMSLFCLNRRNSRIEHSIFRMYYFKIYENSELVHNLIPCYRKSDSVIGLYDIVNDTFYTNNGTGTFTKGSDVSGAIVTCVTPGECVITVTANATGDTDTCSITDVASITYSYDFTDGTWTDQRLIDDGWLGVNAGYTGVPYDTGYHYGVTMRNGGVDFRDTGTDRDGNFLKKIDVNISDFTTITFKVRGSKNASWGGLYGKFCVNNNGSEYIICGAECSYNAGRGALIGPGGTTLASDGSRYSVDAILTINLLTGAWSGTLNGTSYSGTMSMPTIPSGDKYIGAYFSKGFYGTPTGLYELSIKLE